MQLMIVLSLLLNVAILLPVCVGLLTDAGWAEAAYGADAPARRILLSVYLAIGTVSFILLLVRDPKLVAALLLVQIVYKFVTLFAVGTLADPVIVSNLFIAAFHSITLFVIWRTLQDAQ